MKKPVSFRFDPVIMPHMEAMANATNRSVAREVEDALELAYEIFLAVKDNDKSRSKYAVQRYADALKIRVEEAKMEKRKTAPE